MKKSLHMLYVLLQYSIEAISLFETAKKLVSASSYFNVMGSADIYHGVECYQEYYISSFSDLCAFVYYDAL